MILFSAEAILASSISKYLSRHAVPSSQLVNVLSLWFLNSLLRSLNAGNLSLHHDRDINRLCQLADWCRPQTLKGLSTLARLELKDVDDFLNDMQLWGLNCLFRCLVAHVWFGSPGSHRFVQQSVTAISQLSSPRHVPVEPQGAWSSG